MEAALKGIGMPSASQFVLLRIDGPVAHISLNRSETANAYDGVMLSELDRALDAIVASQRVTVAILSTTSKNFCAGADLSTIAVRSPGDILHLKSRQIFERIAGLPVVFIAAVKGGAMAGGFELALACDFIIAAESSRFGLPEVHLGLIPAAGGITRLVRHMGPRATKAIVLCGRTLDAIEAHAQGIVTEVVKDEDLSRVTQEWSKMLASQPASALQVAKLAIDEAAQPTRSTLELFGQMFLNEVRKR